MTSEPQHAEPTLLERIARASNHAANALQGGAPHGWQNWTWESAQGFPGWYDAWMVWKELREIVDTPPAPSAEPASPVVMTRDTEWTIAIAAAFGERDNVNVPCVPEAFADCLRGYIASLSDAEARFAQARQHLDAIALLAQEPTL